MFYLVRQWFVKLYEFFFPPVEAWKPDQQVLEVAPLTPTEKRYEQRRVPPQLRQRPHRRRFDYQSHRCNL